MRCLILVLFAYVAGFVQKSFSDTISGSHCSAHDISASITLSSEITKAPLYVAPLSLIPGCGQVYNRSYIKAGLMLGGGISLGLYANNRNTYVTYLRDSEPDWDDSVSRYETVLRIDSTNINGETHFDTSQLSTQYTMFKKISQYDIEKSRTIFYHPVSWLSFLYVFSVCDALDGLGYFYSATSKSPALAGWLSAVPGLGLGQLYNGSVSKAGFIWMTHFSLALQVYNYHQLMLDAEKEYVQITDEKNKEYAFRLSSSRVSHPQSSLSFLDVWEGKRADAFRNRNVYLWYLLLFYFYGIFDAVVDAHLHDMPSKMRLEPDLILNKNRAHIGVKISY